MNFPNKKGDLFLLKGDIYTVDSFFAENITGDIKTQNFETIKDFPESLELNIPAMLDIDIELAAMEDSKYVPIPIIYVRIKETGGYAQLRGCKQFQKI